MIKPAQQSTYKLLDSFFFVCLLQKKTNKIVYLFWIKRKRPLSSFHFYFIYIFRK